jgi:ketosteroid isomerase-like protein
MTRRVPGVLGTLLATALAARRLDGAWRIVHDHTSSGE